MTAKKETPATTQTPAPARSGQPLSTSEDPTLIGKRNINKGIIAKMSGGIDKEVAMGRQIAAEVDRQAKFIEDPVITEYVNRVGQNVVLHSDAKIPFTIKVIDSDEVNAFALPGGFFYVNKGLLLAADNEAELAGVMAHEIAHVAARHAVENQTKATITQYAILIPAIVLGGGAGQAIYQAGNFGALLGFMKFSRDAESEADRLGVQYLYAAGYDPSAMATMFEKLSAQNKKKPGALSKAFASHPQPPDRRAASIALVARFPEREEYVISTSEFQRVKAHLLRLSNARATTAGNIAAGENGAPGRPTLKRRTPGPDDSTTTPSTDDTKPTTDQQSGPPKLKRRDSGDPTTAPAQPADQP
jgi:predicted Zn-dependent protease